jgi:methylglutamate dehydrogenase subunit D
VSDLSLSARSPLAGLMKPGMFGAAVPQSGVAFCEVQYLGLASMIARRGCGPALVAAVREHFGSDLPLLPRRVEAGEFAFVWTGFEQWLVSRRGAASNSLEEQLEKLRTFASISDLSDAHAIVRVSGPQARRTLLKGIAIDLHPRAFKTGDCAVTMIGHMGAILWQIDDGPTYDIAVFRSLAESFWLWLTESAAQYGYRVDDSL